ncbi:MAG: class I SAM-dependent methyltransferase [Geobacteraceae bacterium]|nr:class I SAM-dependent methyltransferase [Geobacteraceae bacterium]
MICPWWLGFAIDNPLRRLFHDPGKILGPYVRPGNSVIDVGAGTGFFSIPLAGMVGPAGRVTAIDIQPEMLAALVRKARARGVSQIIKPHLASRDSLGDHSGADFILAFWVVHEVPDQRVFLEELRSFLKPGGLLLLVEPLVHVSGKSFLRTIETAAKTGFAVEDAPKIRLSRGTLMARKEATG